MYSNKDILRSDDQVSLAGNEHGNLQFYGLIAKLTWLAINGFSSAKIKATRSELVEPPVVMEDGEVDMEGNEVNMEGDEVAMEGDEMVVLKGEV